MNEPPLVSKHVRPIFGLTRKIWLIRTEVETLLQPPLDSSFSNEQLHDLKSIIAKLKQIESDIVAEIQQKMKS